MSSHAVLDDNQARQRDLAAIHMGAKALGWGEDEYRDILWTVCTVRSAALLDFAGRKRFLAHLRACGWRGGVKGPGDGRQAARRPFSPRQGKAWSLWQQLADARRVHDRSAKGLDAYVRNQLGVDKMVWLNVQQLDLLIERLKQWLKRDQAGVPRPGADDAP